MTVDHRQALLTIKRFDQLIAYLRDELGWPISKDSFDDVDDLFYDFSAEELGIDPKTAAKIQEIKRLRPLSTKQPWGIFFVKFEPKKLPVVALRRILSQVALKKRASANSSERTAWSADDLLFISNYGEGDERQISFAHFSQPANLKDLPTLRVLGWNNLDTPLHLDSVANELTQNLRWPEDENLEQWKKSWTSAFKLTHNEVINTSKDLSIRLAELASGIRDRIKTTLSIESEFGPLTKLMKAFQASLINDLEINGFADMYAQTIAYGLLSARITDPSKKTIDDFTSHMRTSPFLKELMETFLHIGGRKGKVGGIGIDFDELGISDVIQLLDDANMEAVIRDFGDKNRQEDPVMHFFEGFLEAYDKKIRKDRGVFYTPQSAVSYIVKSTHETLKNHFGLPEGLASTTTWGEMIKKFPHLRLPPMTEELKDGKTISPNEPFVQILDPATGTATFLVEVIDVIFQTLEDKWIKEGLTSYERSLAWNEYVPAHLLPRLHAFELMMAPYTIAHMKVGLKLAETGYNFTKEERARIYLTNALEPCIKQPGLIGLEALAHEAEAVNKIKAHKRFTVIIGNPPYSGVSSNMSEHAQHLIDAYKLVDGQALNERKLWLQDDYVKFIRKSQQTVEFSGAGILGFITNNGYFENPTFRGMRQSLMSTYQQLYILDLHGNANKKEKSPDGGEDKNIFDIRQGVGICLGVKLNLEKKYFHFDLWGSRDHKYRWLSANSSKYSNFIQLHPDSPFYFFKTQNIDRRSEYDVGWKINDIKPVNSAGFITARDHFVIDIDAENLRSKISAFADAKLTDEEIRAKYFSGCGSAKYPDGDTRGWKVPIAREKVRSDSSWAERIVDCLYRPFDFRSVYWAEWMIDWPRPDVMSQMLEGDNLALLTARSNKSSGADHFFCTNLISEAKCAEYSTQSAVFPLYVYEKPSSSQGVLNLSKERRPNLSQSFLSNLSSSLNLPPSGPYGLPRGISPENIFQYIYAIFYSPGYRGRYSEFLESDFPRIPLTSNLKLFSSLSNLGKNLIDLHLLKTDVLGYSILKFIGKPNSLIEKISWSDNTVWINKSRNVGFEGINKEIWEFSIGGYKVCEKWLKDRKNRNLTTGDIGHYQKIVSAISQTINIMGEIDRIIDCYGGWPDAFHDEV